MFPKAYKIYFICMHIICLREYRKWFEGIYTKWTMASMFIKHDGDWDGVIQSCLNTDVS